MFRNNCFFANLCLDCSIRISNLETGAELHKIELKKLDQACSTLAVDKTQTLMAVGTGRFYGDNGPYRLVVFETETFTEVKEFTVNEIESLAFNKRNDCLLAVTGVGEVYCFKFYRSKAQ